MRYIYIYRERDIYKPHFVQLPLQALLFFGGFFWPLLLFQISLCGLCAYVYVWYVCVC